MFDDASSQPSRRAFLKTAGVTTATMALAGCTNVLGPSQSTDSKSVTIKTRHYGTGEMEEYLDTHTTQFEKEEGITVEYEIIGWGDGPDAQKQDMRTQSGPDVDEIPSSFIPGYSALEGFQDLNQVNVDINTDAFFDNPLGIGKYNDKFIGIPWFWGPRAHISYMPELEKAGIDAPPTTWDELVSKGNAYNEANSDTHLFGIPTQSNVSQFFADFVWQNGGALLNDDNSKATFDSSEAVAALNYYKDLQSTHSVMPKDTAEWDGEQRDSRFLNHKIQSTWASLATVDNFTSKESISKEDITITKPPAGPNGDSAIFYGLELVGIHPWTDHPEEAAKWLNYLAKPSVNAEVAQTTGFLPAVEKSFEQDSFDDPVWQGFYDITEIGKTFPQVENWGKVEDIMNGAVKGVLQDAATGKWSDGDTKKALTDAAKQANSELGN